MPKHKVTNVSTLDSFTLEKEVGAIATQRLLLGQTTNTIQSSSTKGGTHKEDMIFPTCRNLGNSQSSIAIDFPNTKT